MKKNRFITYNLIIALSTIDIAAAIILLCYAGYLLITLCFGSAGQKTAFNITGEIPDETIVSANYEYIKAAISAITGVICFAFVPVLTRIRQRLRDEVEYDENGLSKKFGSFSQLSKKEREAIDKQKLMDSERLLPSTQVKSITHPGPKDPMKELGALIGLSRVKQDVLRMEARMRYETEHLNGDKKKKDKNKRLSAMHMIFYGSPGTGKTTVARIMTSILHQYGYIRKNQCIEIDGNFFNGLSAGESSRKCSMLIQKALGGVLFIDEAYSMLDSNGQEVIATIVKAMEDHRDEIIFIFAGYSKEMETFVDSNPGIESRVKTYMFFEDYNEYELKQIFISMANQKNLCVDLCLLDKVGEYLVTASKRKNFGNARTARNLLDKIIDEHAYNMSTGALSDKDAYRLMPCDMISLSSDGTFKR